MNRTNDLSRLGWLDYGISALAGSLSVFSMGMGLANPQIGYLLIAVIIAGTLTSYAIHRLTRPVVHVAGGFLFATACFLAFVNASRLNVLLPGEGVPVQLMTAASLAWMLALGSFFQWRETTLIFQAVPTIALFGLVGTWDTFNAAPFAFFGFLLCFATLFARAHSRLMMRQAEDSGFADEEPTADSFTERLKSGPWRWMAGAEWALASALGVVLLSVLGAPVIKASVGGVAKNVGITPPRPPRTDNQRRIVPDPLRGDTGGDVTVGQGPRSLDNRVVFRTNLTQARYLRMHTYDQYTGRGWKVIPDFRTRSQANTAVLDSQSLFSLSRDALQPFRLMTFVIRFEAQIYDSVPLPGEVNEGLIGSSANSRPDGTLQNSGFWRDFQLSIRVPDGSEPMTAGKGLPPVYSDRNVITTERVRSFAQKAIQGAKNDYEKAIQLKRAIEEQVEYDLKAPAVPVGSDAVDYFLFESKRGYCDLFGTAMTTLARSVGLPARYVSGFYPARDIRDANGNLVLHQSEAHAWSEVFFEGAGWVAMDATEGAPTVGESTREVPVFEQPWLRTALLLGVGLLAVLGPFAGKRLLVRKAIPIDPQLRTLGKAYGQFVRAIEKGTGRPKRPGETPFEYAARVEGDWAERPAELDALNQRFVAAFYSPRAEVAEELLVAARAFRKGVKKK